MTNTTEYTEPNRQKLFEYISFEFGYNALESQLQDVERIVIEDLKIDLIKAEAIQKYLLELGINDEFINNELLILKGLKERVDKSNCEHTFITSADWRYQSCSKCGFKVQIVKAKES